MQVYVFWYELGIGFRELKDAVKDVADDMGFDVKKMRPLSKFTEKQVEEIKLMFQKVEPKPEPEIKEEPKNKATIPWKPARLLDIPEEFKDPNFTYRWCTTNRPGNIRKKQSEGWIIDKDLSKKMTDIDVPTLNDGKPLDGVVGVRELIVMKIPNEKAQARRDYYQKRGEISTKAKQEELDNEVRKLGGKTYGAIEERQGQ